MIYYKYEKYIRSFLHNIFTQVVACWRTQPIKRLKRDEKAVSPVIAIILLVAITVVLAASLFLMIGDLGEEEELPLAAVIDIEEYNFNEEDEVLERFVLNIESLSQPNSAELDDIEVRIVYEDDGTPMEYIIELEEEAEEDEYVSGYTGLDNGDMNTGTTIFFEDIDIELGGSDDIELDRIEMRVDGSQGSTSRGF